MFRPARKWLSGFWTCLFLALASGWIRASDAPNSCIACHRSLVGVRYLEHDFKDWEQSVHAKNGVSCEACHGGDPAEADAGRAHKGLKPSTDSSSPVYFTRLPATCGACHQAEFKAFQKSVHSQELQRSGRGPNCVSCHGSMANHLLSPRDVDLSCTLCHSKPTQASATLPALNQAAASVKRLEASLQEAKNRRVDVAAQEKVFQALQAQQRSAVEDWHTFKMDAVLKASQEITQRAHTAINEVRLKEQQQ